MNKIFDFKNLTIEWDVSGICSLMLPKTRRASEAISGNLNGSRGEFVGYLCDNDKVFLFRDRIGARNLYYSIFADELYISTDILWIVKKTLPSQESRIAEFNDGRVDYALNTNYILDRYLKFQVPFNCDTFYDGIYRVMPGEIVTIEGLGLFPKIVKTGYWFLEFNERKFSPLDLHDLIVDAVEFRKRIVERLSQGRFTSYCSGGIDSSTITSLIKPLEFFSGFYEDELYNEMSYVSTLKNVGSPHLVKITEDRFYKFLTHLSYIIPDPMGGLGVIPQLIVAMETFKSGYHYAFTGEGGDEIFYGYPWNTLVIEVAKTVKNLFRDKYMVRWEGMAEKFLEDAFFPMMINLIRKGNEGDFIPWKWDKSQPVENNIMRFNIEIGLPAILTIDEGVGLYSGVMPVSPLIDHRIVEYVASINPEERTKIPKHLLREAIKGVVPDRIRFRYDKMGFPVPYEQWKWPMLQEFLRSLKKREIVSFVPEEHKTMSRRAWGLVNLEMICRTIEEGIK